MERNPKTVEDLISELEGPAGHPAVSSPGPWVRRRLDHGGHAAARNRC